MITLADVVNAIEQNGLEKITGSYIIYNEDGTVPLAGCALGQATINLGFTYKDENALSGRYKYNPSVLTDGLRNSGVSSVANRIIELNDSTGASLATIAAKIREEYSDKLDTVVFDD